MATTTKKSSVSVKAKNATVTKSNYDKSVAKYWQAKVDSAMKKNNMSIWWDSSSNSSSSKNTPQQDKDNAFKSSWSNTVTTTPVVKKTAQQEPNIAQANAFKSSNVINTDWTSWSVLKSVSPKLKSVVPKDDREKKLLDDKIAKFWYAKVEAHLNSKGRTLWWSKEWWPYDPSEYVTQSWAIKSNIYDGKEPDAQTKLTVEELWYERSLQQWADKIIDIKTEAANKESELIKKLNKEKEDRISERNKDIDWVFTKYTEDTTERRKEIADNLDAIKRTQFITSNAAAAQAWQWAWLSEWARQQVEADIAMRASSNINEATWQAINQKKSLDLEEKTAWIESSNEQTKLDILRDNLSDTEWNVWIKLAQDVWVTKALAQQKFIDFWSWLNEESLKWTFNRKEMQTKVDAWEANFKDKNTSNTHRLAIIEQILWDHPSFKLFRWDAYKMILDWVDYNDIINTIAEKAEADYRKYTVLQTAWIQDKSVIDPAIMKSASDYVNSLNK